MLFNHYPTYLVSIQFFSQEKQVLIQFMTKNSK